MSELYTITVAVAVSLLLTAPLAAQTTTNPIFKVGGDITSPVTIQTFDPEYSEEARVAGISGIVQLECIVRKDGTVSVSRILKGLGFGLDEKARAAVEKWRFSPALRNGAAVDVQAVIDVSFNLLLKVGGDVQPPVEKDCPSPKYTDDALKAGIAGAVGLQFVVNYEGKVTVRSVLRKLGYGLDENARTALEQCPFSPATKNGRPVSVLMEADFQFELPQQ